MPIKITFPRYGFRHYGAGGSSCNFIAATHTRTDSKMASQQDKVPSRDTPDYQSYLEEKIVEEEELPNHAQEAVRTSEVECKLAELKLKTNQFQDQEYSSGEQGAMGFADQMLTKRRVGPFLHP